MTQGICKPCGRPDGSSCGACLSGNPPPEKLAEQRAQRTTELRRAIRDALTNLPDAYALLGLFILPGTAPVDPDRIRGTSSPARPPLRLEVLDLLDEREKPDSDPQRTDYDLDRRAGARRQGVLPTLASWTRLVDGEMWDADAVHTAPADQPSVSSECSWLLGNLGWTLEQQWVDEFAADVAAMFEDVRKATGWEREQTRCPKCGWIVEERDGGTWWSCTGCPKTWARKAEIDRLTAAQETSLTLRECAEDVSRPVSTLKEWRARGWIEPVFNGPRGQLFDVRQVREVNGRVTRGPRAKVLA